ncbi:hypothetical protein PHLCEN_2v11562 [Hermanssonia centrifuga]|uniref:F-box domain-containing protein n=1 Tax=Hermanssonia centrifuga TaxID=98765 RepID=A0A2R6NJM2_9APHY|nr:hypothetical protein PHLCEN_2v11562 [Hermanssonia centrifuga]
MSDAFAHIPQEIIDDIIDLISSKTDLSSCTLVSRSWLTRSRRNLFAEVNLKDKGVQNQFHSFLAFLTANDKDSLLGPPISGCIQRVCIHNCRPLSKAREKINTDMLRSLLFLLPNLRDLELSKATLSGVTPSDPAGWLVSRPIHLDSLSLLGTTTVSQNPSEIIASLCLFSSIKVLRIEMFVTVEGFERLYSYPQNLTAQSTHPLLSTEDPYFPSRLRVSSIKSPNYSQTPFFLALIAKTASAETITDVDVACRTSDQIRALGSFLSVVGRRIKKITVDVIKLSSESHSNLTPSDILQASNLSACTALTHLTLRMTLHPYHREMNIIAFTAVRTFLSVTPTTAQTVILEIQLTGLNHFYELWDLYLHRIRSTAASEFTDLQSAIKQREEVRKFCIRWGDMQRDRLEEQVIDGLQLFARAQLSELDADGILCFESM